MKRVAKFQEGGDVEMTAAERRRQNIQRINQRRATNREQAAVRSEIERFNERMRQGTLTADDARRMGAEAPRPQMTAAEQRRQNIQRLNERRATNRMQAAERAEIERFNERLRQGTLTADDMRRMGAEAPQRPAAPAPSMRDVVRPVGPSAGRPALRGPGIAGAAGTLLALAPAAMEAYNAYRNRPITGEFERSMDPEGSNEAADAERERQSSQPAPAGPPARSRPAPRQQPARGAARAAPREMTADDLNEIVLRLNRGEKPVTETEKRLADRMGIAYRKGGMVKGKGMHMMPDGSMMKNKDHAAMKKGGKAMMYREGGKVRQGMQSPKAQEARAEMAEDVMKRSMPAEPKRRMRDMMSPGDRREYDAPLTPQERERMRESGFKKGGMIKPKTAMKKGGAVKAPAKKMAHGGKVHGPKKMMKGGMTSKPKKMMGGGRAMYAKGGMAKGKC